MALAQRRIARRGPGRDRFVLNWERRYQLMRTHTAMHILCGVIFRDYGASVTGGNMEPLKARMDFELEHLSKDLVCRDRSGLMPEIAKAHPVRDAHPASRRGLSNPGLDPHQDQPAAAGYPEVRTVEIVGLDLQADGGTHVANTAKSGASRWWITNPKARSINEFISSWGTR